MPSGERPRADDDALRRLEERLDRASQAAERLVAEAAQARKPPPGGWQTPPREPESGDLELLAQLLDSVRELIPPELQRRLAEALRELLLALRALIDFSLERIERGPEPNPGGVEDIPIT
jgi:hypothetical protein